MTVFKTEAHRLEFHASLIKITVDAAGFHTTDLLSEPLFSDITPADLAVRIDGVHSTPHFEPFPEFGRNSSWIRMFFQGSVWWGA